jgi:peptidoglycan/LPS O-acetylase OafA/YrhL
MRKKLDILESVRGAAALYVAIEHLLFSLKDVPDYILLPFKFGKEAVVVFFLLSGFVIHYSNKNSESFKTYFIKRFRRIYGPVLIVFFLSVVLYYYNNSSFSGISGLEFIGNLLMLQDFKGSQPGNWFNCFLGNSPLWSLSYEWWFYMLYYPICRYVKATNKLPYIFIFSAINWFIFLIFPNHIALVFSMFLIWWSGAELADLYIKKELISSHKIKQIILYNLVMLLFAAVPLLYINKQLFKFGYFPISTLRYFAAGLAFIAGALIWNKYKWKGFLSLFGIFKIVSPISFGIYIVHYPIFFQLNIPITNVLIQSIIKIVLIFFLAYLLEIIIQPFINKLLSVKRKN